MGTGKPGKTRGRALWERRAAPRLSTGVTPWAGDLFDSPGTAPRHLERVGQMSIRVCVAGATGWVGRALAPALRDRADLRLSAAVARAAAGQRVGEVLSVPCEVPIRASVALA